MSWSIYFSAKAADVPSVIEKLSATYANAERDCAIQSILAVVARAPQNAIVTVEGQGAESYSYRPIAEHSNRVGNFELKIGIYAEATPPA